MDNDKVDIRHWSIEFHGRNSLENASSSNCQPCKANFVEGSAWSVDHVGHDITDKVNLSKFSSRIFWKSKTSDRMIDLSLNFETEIPTSKSFNFIASKERHPKSRVIRSSV